ncbi:hypothetical protein TNIN_463491 [Trichonephila inaurata madagascariensis]|uniref:Uncharacterized protein n=1 Tax=Trichonephila inaurata madagascariensis TaxID=2747483 RepID=A0A8X7CLV2_9ARAC|nr:hypothetical protein TNIN_463491 [Trichonephila inaurata madagascariensis]
MSLRRIVHNFGHSPTPNNRPPPKILARPDGGKKEWTSAVSGVFYISSALKEEAIWGAFLPGVSGRKRGNKQLAKKRRYSSHILKVSL